MSLQTQLPSPRRMGPATAATVLSDLLTGPEQTDGAMAPIHTGFRLLDQVLDGGLRRNDLMLIGGTPGVGKTVAALQMARQVAAQGRPAIYVCYEHDAEALLGRLLCLELGDLALPQDAADADELRVALLEATAGQRSLKSVLNAHPLARAAGERVDSYAETLWLLRGSGAHTGLPELREVVTTHGGSGCVLFVDYLQKVAVRSDPGSEAEKVTQIAEGLKDLTLAADVAVVAVVAADREGIKAQRLRLHHLRGSSALAYECDIAVVLNDKHRSVAKVHLAYDSLKAETFKRLVVFSIEKNRGGQAHLDLEFRKDFRHYRFDPDGAFVAERLAEEA